MMVSRSPGATARQMVVGNSLDMADSPARWQLLISRRITNPLQRLADALAVIAVSYSFHLETFLLTALVILIILTVMPHLYRFRLGISVLDELPQLLLVGTIAPFITAVLLNPASPALHSALFALATVGSLLTAKIIVSVFLRIRRSRTPAVLSRTLILGSGPIAQELARSLAGSPKYGLRPVAMVDNDPEPTPDIPGMILQPFTRSLPDLIREYRADTVVIAFGRYEDERLLHVLRSCVREDAELYIIPRLPEYHDRDNSTEMIGAIPLRHVSRAAYRSFTWFLKRPFDMLISGLALLLVSPVLAVLAVLVKRENPDAPILFRQTRIGLDGEPFELLKFRTLTPARAEESDSHWNIAGDKRLTKLGAVMRRYSLDELPQIYNVFRGDMALVGPRPERPYFVDKFGQEIPGYLERHRVPVGLTGWAAINGLRGDTSIRERVLYDNYYIENWSPWLDVKIMILTLRAVVCGSGG